MILTVVTLLSFCAISNAHVLPAQPWRWGALSDEVTIDPGSIKIELDSSDLVTVSFRSDVDRNVTIGFLYDYGDAALHLDPGEIIAPLDNVTLNANETRPIEVKATKPGTVIIVCASSEVDISKSTYTRITVERSAILGVIDQVTGWTYFVVWTLGYYPQMITNFKRKSVIGLNFDFLGLNTIGQVAYAVFTVGMYFIPEIQDQYLRRHPRGVLPVELNDVVYVVHGATMYFFMVFQCIIYERGGQRMSWTGIVISVATCAFMAVAAVLGAVDTIEWLDVLSYASYVKLFVTFIRCIPQIYMNFRRKSTRGFSIGSVLLDLTGGVFSSLQMVIVAYNHDDWNSITGNPTKFGHGLFAILFDVVFIIQHYFFYRHPVEEEPLLTKDTRDNVDSKF